MDGKWGRLIKRVDYICTEITFPIIPKGTKLNDEIHKFLNILKEIDAQFDTQGDKALLTLDTAIKSLGVATYIMFDRLKLVQVHTNLKELKAVIRPYITQLIHAAEEFLKFAEGENELPIQLVEILQNLIPHTQQIQQLQYQDVLPTTHQIQQLQYPKVVPTTQQRTYSQPGSHDSFTTTTTTYVETPVPKSSDMHNFHSSQIQEQQLIQQIQKETQIKKAAELKENLASAVLQLRNSEIEMKKIKEMDAKRVAVEAATVESKKRQEAEIKKAETRRQAIEKEAERRQRIADINAEKERARLKTPVPAKKALVAVVQAKEKDDKANKRLQTEEGKQKTAIDTMEERHKAEIEAASEKVKKTDARENQRKEATRLKDERLKNIDKALISTREAKKLADDAKKLLTEKEKEIRRAKGEAIQQQNDQLRKERDIAKIAATKARQNTERLAAEAKANKQTTAPRPTTKGAASNQGKKSKKKK